MREQPLSQKYEALAQAVEARLGDRIERLATTCGELAFRVERRSLLEVSRLLRDSDDLRFEVLIDVCGLDYLAYGQDEWQTEAASGTGFSRGVHRYGGLTEPPAPVAQEVPPDVPRDTDRPEYRPPARFAVAYHLLSVTHNHRVRLKVFCDDSAHPIVDSVTSIWSSADWFEREAFDLFGILFRGHPDLRRLLTDYGFIGYPFRKDFPLIGNVEVRYDPEKGRVIYEPVEIEPRTLVPKVIRHDHRYEPDLKDQNDA
jgi:NADH-quinone oxidoreductase subunit C